MFQATAHIIDDFDQADEDPITGWTDLWTGFQVVSHHAMGIVDADDNLSYLTAPGGMSDFDLYAQLIALPADLGGIAGIVTHMTKAYSSMAMLNYVRNDPDDNVLKIATQAGETSELVSLSAGDYIGFRARGGTLEGWYKHGAGAWTLGVQRIEDDPQAGAYYGFYTTSTLTAFGTLYGGFAKAGVSKARIIGGV
jgi:hypothetical protein